jgi:hypothetical protein
MTTKRDILPNREGQETIRQSIHIFRANAQPATRYKTEFGFWMRFKPTQLLSCWNCERRRQAKNLVVQSYYDGDRFFCKGGCK